MVDFNVSDVIKTDWILLNWHFFCVEVFKITFFALPCVKVLGIGFGVLSLLRSGFLVLSHLDLYVFLKIIIIFNIFLLASVEDTQREHGIFWIDMVSFIPM